MANALSDSPKPSPKSEVRLQKYLALCGLGSRRACESLITQGWVEVDGTPVTRLGSKISPDVNRVTVKGQPVQPDVSRIYIALNKPRDVLCTSSDPRGRRTFRDLLGDLPDRVYTVGRLDRNSEGLLLITNDGDFAHALMHPRHQVAKIYRAWVSGALSATQIQNLRQGVRSEGELLRAEEVRRLSPEGDTFSYEIVLKEGRNRQLRRMFAALGFEVTRLQRTAIGPVTLKGLKRGGWRALSEQEIKALRKSAGGLPGP